MKLKIPNLKTVSIEKSSCQTIWEVTPIWKDVDRPDTISYSCGSNKKLAERLANAFFDGGCYKDPEITKDCNGKTYVSYQFLIRMRCANADLKRLGY